MASAPISNPDSRIPFWRNQKILEVLAQVLFVVILVALFWFFIANMQARLTAIKGESALRFNFLNTAAGFQIGEGPAFSAQESYGRAFLIGVANTLRVAIVGIILATLLGILAGIARLSRNWLVVQIAAVYIETVRSTPLLVQLFFWYFGVILALPDINAPQELAGIATVTNRGIYVTSIHLSALGKPWQGWLLGALLLAAGVGWWRRRQLQRQGRIGSGLGWALITFALVAAIGYGATAQRATLPPTTVYQLARGDRGTLYVDRNGDGDFSPADDLPLAFVPVTLRDGEGKALGTVNTDAAGAFRFYDLPDDATGESLTWVDPALIVLDPPRRQGFNFAGGLRLTPEFVGLLLGLVIYTGAFIAEIVRAGINAVSHGQWEAGRSLGLRRPAIMRLIVLPQALRVIIPPLTNQYLNLTKNSSLAIAIGYPDLFNVSLTILNQTGAEIQMFLLTMLTYLSFSLVTSLFMNWYNARIAFTER
jgi:general L-amino acid transport system permease protein